ncbi:MAG: hypothetical protein RLZZ230_619 [Candidatus Parcubacteria bacterium]|jgi:hypothetical protein
MHIFFIAIIVHSVLAIVLMVIISLITCLYIKECVRDTQYLFCCTLSLVGLNNEQKQMLIKLLQYKQLFDGNPAGYNLTGIRCWNNKLVNKQEKNRLYSECQKLQVPDWRIKIAL